MRIHYLLLIFSLLVLTIGITAFVTRDQQKPISRQADRITVVRPPALSEIRDRCGR